MTHTPDGVLPCPYCGRELHWVPLRWFGRGCFECEHCGEFPDLADAGPREPAAAAHSDSAAVARPRKHDGRPRVLLVDDSVEHRGLYALMLEPTATVLTASRGEDALAIAAAEPLDAIVLDVMMPGMDGWQTCERLKASPLTSTIPVIMLTSLDGLDVPQRADRIGAAAVLIKPCSVERLAIAIQEAIQRRPEAAAVGGEPLILRPFDQLRAVTTNVEGRQAQDEGRVEESGVYTAHSIGSTPPAAATRRWSRKPVTVALSARVNALPAQILNLSYGGLCVELERLPHGLPSWFAVSVPASQLSIYADTVWTSRSSHETWLCGAEIAEASDAWRNLVDAVR